MAASVDETCRILNQKQTNSSHVQNPRKDLNLLPTAYVFHIKAVFQRRGKQSCQRSILKHEKDILQPHNKALKFCSKSHRNCSQA